MTTKNDTTKNDQNASETTGKKGFALGLVPAVLGGVPSALAILTLGPGAVAAAAAIISAIVAGTTLASAAARADAATVAATLAAGAGTDISKSNPQYSPKKVLAGTLAGAALSAAMNFTAVAHGPKAPERTVDQNSKHVLQIEPQGRALYRPQ